MAIRCLAENMLKSISILGAYVLNPTIPVEMLVKKKNMQGFKCENSQCRVVYSREGGNI